MSTKFERENRYLVLKRRDISNSLTELEQQILREITTKVRLYREGTMQKQPLQCVVVEHDWPEYEPTWKAIEERMTAKCTCCARGGEYNGFGSDGPLLFHCDLPSGCGCHD